MARGRRSAVRKNPQRICVPILANSRATCLPRRPKDTLRSPQNGLVHLWLHTFSCTLLKGAPFGCISGSIPLAAQTCQVHHSGASLAPHPLPHKSVRCTIRVHLWLHILNHANLPGAPFGCISGSTSLAAQVFPGAPFGCISGSTPLATQNFRGAPFGCICSQSLRAAASAVRPLK